MRLHRHYLNSEVFLVAALFSVVLAWGAPTHDLALTALFILESVGLSLLIVWAAITPYVLYRLVRYGLISG